MKNQEKSEIKLNVFEVFSLFWVSFAILILATTLFSFFNVWTISIFFALLAILTSYLIKKEFILIEKLDKFSVATLALIIVLGIFLSFFTTPTIFGGRDEGSYASSAILISQTGNLIYESSLINAFFDINEPGKALNFPGFYYTEDGQLKSQFLPGYPSWLAIFYSIGGLKGLQFANLIPFITFIFSFFLIINLILKKANYQESIIKKTQTIALAILLSSFPLLVFYKFTLSEIYFASLAWFSLYLVLKYLENKSFENYFVIFIPLVLMLFIRVETIGIIFFFLFIMILKDAKSLQKPLYQIPFVATGIFFVIAVYFEPNFFIDSFKNIIPFDIDKNGIISENTSSNFSWLPDDWKNFYLFKIFIAYNLLALFIMAGIVILKSISKFSLSSTDRVKKDISKINSFTLIPFVFFFPTFIYFFDANISLDHPWLLRRFLFSIIPIAILYSGIFLTEMFQKNKIFFRLLFILIVVINFSLFFPNIEKIDQNFLTFSQNKNLLNQAEKIAENFSVNDLILVSQQSSGSSWSLFSEPMRNIMRLNAVYFFNPNDLEKLNLNNFENIYLITSKKEFPLYSGLNVENDPQEYVISNSIIDPSKNPENKPQTTYYEKQVLIYKIKK